jgi:hypothetical protein
MSDNLSAWGRTLCGRLLRLLFYRSRAADAEAAEPSRLLLAADSYNTGFTLAKLGDFTGCLRLWQSLDSDAAEFLSQKAEVGRLLIHALHRRLDECPLAQEAEVSLLVDEFALADLPGGAELLARCRNLRLARLWQEERLDEIAALADAADWLQPAVLEIHAKSACQRMTAGTAVAPAAAIRRFIDCWLTLLFHPQVGPQDEALRQTLLDYGANLVRKQAVLRPTDGTALLCQWQGTLVLLQRLRGLTAGPVHAPMLALRAGTADQLCALIRSSTETFTRHEDWLAAGAAYSAAAPALLLIREGDYDAALADAETADDPFAAWGAATVRTACGADLLRRGACRDASLLLAAGPVQWNAELEQQLLAALNRDETEEGGRLTACLNILALLPEHAPTRAEFCAALSNQVVRLRCSGEAHPRLLAAVMAQAAALNPGDEFAQLLHDQVRLDLELAALDEAFDQDCFAQAACIAAASRFPQAVEHFFETAGQAAAKIERGDYADREAAIFQLEELLAGASKADAAHGETRRIRQVLDGLRRAGAGQ